MTDEQKTVIQAVEKNVVSFVEGTMSAKSFSEWLYGDEAEKLFVVESDLPVWAKEQAVNLYYFLISGNWSDSHFVSSAKELLEQYLKKHGIAFAKDSSYAENYDILCGVMPKWLDIENYYFEDIFENGSLNKSEKSKAIKERIKSDFSYIHHPPHWLQAPAWPIENGSPLIFVGELELSKEKGRARVYVFFNRQNNNYKVVNQAM